jgi:hypothetical protein
MSEWKTIESARKVHLTMILGYWPTTSRHDSIKHYFEVLTWIGGESAWLDAYGEEHKPTHWQPLPLPPVSRPDPHVYEQSGLDESGHAIPPPEEE